MNPTYPRRVRCVMSLVPLIGGLVSGCRDYTCFDTASCPTTSDGGLSSISADAQVAATATSSVDARETTSTDVNGFPTTIPSPEPSSTGSNTPGAPTSSEGAPTEPGGCNECSSGEASCAGGQQLVCELRSGCWVWSEPRPCPDGMCADTVNCSDCTDLCDVDATACSAGSIQTCEEGPDGCYLWSAPSPCASQECADDANCFTCVNTCQVGEARCSGGALQRCEADTRGCLDWGASMACDPATCATATSCVLCDDKCSIGETSCSDGELTTCVADSLGCLDWSTPSACGTGECSSSTECLVCNNRCPSAGTTSCQAGQLRTCEEDPNGCLDWSDASSCETGTCASSSACFECEDRCTSGSYSCSGNQLSSCSPDARGCLDYRAPTTCGGNTPVCSASNGRCECQSGATPTCTNATTVSQCSNGAWADSACSGGTPVCVAGLGCQACTEHSQCPNSACHLAGPKKGTCFAANTVVNVNSAATLLNAVNATSVNGEAVIKMSAGTYTMTSALAPKGETALVGQTGVVIVDNIPFPGDGRATFMGSSGIAYFAKFELRNSSADHAGIGAGTGGIVWLDDIKIRGENTGVLTNGECHLRRSSVSNHTSGVLAYYAGSIFLENTMIGPAATSSGTTGVGAYSGGVMDVRYSTIIGNDRGIGCSVGASAGRIANSIIASNVNGHSIADDFSDCSEAFTLANNAVDQNGYGTKIPVYSSTWFTGANNGDLHLSAAGRVAIPAIAVRGSGDPLLDFDGNPRPANAGFPGADEP